MIDDQYEIDCKYFEDTWLLDNPDFPLDARALEGSDAQLHETAR